MSGYYDSYDNPYSGSPHDGYLMVYDEIQPTQTRYSSGKTPPYQQSFQNASKMCQSQYCDTSSLARTNPLNAPLMTLSTSRSSDGSAGSYYADLPPTPVQIWNGFEIDLPAADPPYNDQQLVSQDDQRCQVPWDSSMDAYLNYDSVLESYEDTIPQQQQQQRLSKPNAKSVQKTPKTNGAMCLEPGCTSLTVFARKADLQRHLKTVHDPKSQLRDCPKHRCTRTGDNGFTRPDHLKEHLRSYHKDDIEKRSKGRSGNSRRLQ